MCGGISKILKRKVGILPSLSKIFEPSARAGFSGLLKVRSPISCSPIVTWIVSHDYMGPGYGTRLCWCSLLHNSSFWWPLNYFQLINVFNILIIILKFSIKKIKKIIGYFLV